MTATPQHPADGGADGLDDLTTDDLRHRAVDVARRRRDVGFFWDLLKHLPASVDTAHTGDMSAGGTFETVQEAVELVREWRSSDYGDREPLLRARFLQYLRAHPEAAPR